MATVQVWIVMSEDGNIEVAPDETTALDRLQETADGEGQDISGELCRLVQLNVVMNEPRYSDDETKDGGAVDVVVPDQAGRTMNIE